MEVDGSRGELSVVVPFLLKEVAIAAGPIRPAGGERYGSYASAVISRVTLAQCAANSNNYFWPRGVAKNGVD